MIVLGASLGCADMFFNQSGLGPLAAVVATEIVDASIRGLAMGIAMVGTGAPDRAGPNVMGLPSLGLETGVLL
jgi:hypothetical protein